MKIDSLTDIGVRRKENQDNYWSALLKVDGEDAGVICLCDGMGGLNNGGLASRIVVESVRDYFKSNIDFDGLSTVLQHANNTIHSIAVGEGSRMGTTCTVLLCYEGIYRILHVGDSRCYLLRDHNFSALTRDHSALAKYKITKDKNPDLYKKYKNSLTRCIGVKEFVQTDYIEGEYLPGDTFLCCSDGLWHYFDDYTYSEEQLFQLPELIKKCIDSGETDNITVGLLTV